MLGLFGDRKRKRLEEETKKGFLAVKKDLDGVGQWLKHLDSKDKHLFEILNDLKRELSTINNELDGLKEAVSFMNMADENKQLSKKTPVYDEQTAVEPVYTAVQTPVQTDDFYDFLHGLSSNERLVIYTLLNTADDMKLSYEDIARLLGKERSTVRGQINSIKQKNESLLQEIVEPNGKKRVYIDRKMKEKMAKYAKVRVRDKKDYKKLPKYVE